MFDNNRGQNNGKQGAKKLNFLVEWIGNDPNYMFSKKFDNSKDALAFVDKNKTAIAYKMDNETKDSGKWKIIPTDSSREMIKAINLKRKLAEKKGLNTFLNADGTGDIEIVTTTEYKRNQNTRILSTVVLSGALAYAGTKMENKYVKYGFFGLSLLNAFFTLRNHQINKIA
jgi:hypothetical protein